MCLGIPGRVERIDPNPLGMTTGVVRFGGVTKQVCLAYVPEAGEGDWVVVHVGFAISRIDEEQAKETFRLLEEIGALEELGDGGGPGAGGPTE